MNVPKDISCLDCVFFVAEAADAELPNKTKFRGMCHRFPQHVSVYPSDWCGEFNGQKITEEFAGSRVDLSLGTISAAPKTTA